MRIISEDDNEQVTKLTLRLKSTETALSLYTEQISPNLMGDLSRPNSAAIIFKDSREIDSLIDALQKFRDRNVRYIGVWR